MLGELAKGLHERYMQGENPLEPHIQTPTDCLAYLAMRFPATYAQIFAALSQIQERVPAWQPRTVLELGCGPGTGIWAAKSIWPSLTSATGVDQEKLFLTLAEEIHFDTKMNLDTTWIKTSLAKWAAVEDAKTYDLIIIANVLNELPSEDQEALLKKVTLRSSGIVIVLEPGTAIGYRIIQRVAKSTHSTPRSKDRDLLRVDTERRFSPLAKAKSLASPNVSISETHTLIAPYIDNTFVESNEYWIHFSQRFQRPEFQRRIRQSMRESSLMASDWEDATYSYVAWGDIPVTKSLWGQCIGKVMKYKGYLIIPLLTKDAVLQARVLKRHKQDYTLAKNIRWGELLETPLNTS